MSILEIKKKPTYTEEILNWFRDSIISGVLEPGERLIETELAENLGVSRVPVREAMKVLASEGVIVENSIRGYEVWTPSLEEVDEIVDLRYALEALAYDVIPGKITDQVYSSFTRQVQMMKDAFKTREYIKTISHDRLFHEKLVKLSGLPRVLSIWTRIMTQWEVIINISTKKKINFTEEQFEGIHQEILDSLNKHDIEHATKLLKFHTDISKNSVKEVLNNSESRNEENYED